MGSADFSYLGGVYGFRPIWQYGYGLHLFLYFGTTLLSVVEKERSRRCLALLSVSCLCFSDKGPRGSGASIADSGDCSGFQEGVDLLAGDAIAPGDGDSDPGLGFLVSFSGVPGSGVH